MKVTTVINQGEVTIKPTNEGIHGYEDGFLDIGNGFTGV